MKPACKDCAYASIGGGCHRALICLFNPPTVFYNKKDCESYSFYCEVDEDLFCHNFMSKKAYDEMWEKRLNG